MPNFVAIGQTVPEIWRYKDYDHKDYRYLRPALQHLANYFLKYSLLLMLLLL